MCIDLLSKLPKDFSKDELKTSLAKMGVTKPVNVCFRQEVDVLQKSLSLVSRGNQGLGFRVWCLALSSPIGCLAERFEVS